MATLRFIPAALDVKDVWKLVIGGTWIAGEKVTLTVGVKDIVLTVGTVVTTAGVAADVKEFWNGDSFTDATASATQTGNNVAEMDEATATVSSSTVLFTMDTAGVPLGLSVSTNSASGTVTLTNPTPATGAEFWDNSHNWDVGTVPATGDTVYIDSTSGSIRHGLAQSGVTLAAMYISQSFTGDIGLPEVNEGGGYEEYRPQSLAIGATILQIGQGAGNGSGRIKIDNGSVQTTLTVFNTGSPAESGLPAVIWKGAHASNAIVQVAGSVGAAVYGGEVATVATVKKQGGDLYTGPGVTLSGALVQDGGTWDLNSAVATSLSALGGTVTVSGTGAVAQLTVQGATVVYNTTGMLGGATVVRGGGQIDFGQDPRAKTVTNAIDAFSLDPVLDPNKVVASLVVDYNGLEAVPGWGVDVRLTRAATA